MAGSRRASFTRLYFRPAILLGQARLQFSFMTGTALVRAACSNCTSCILAHNRLMHIRLAETAAGDAFHHGNHCAVMGIQRLQGHAQGRV